MKKRNVTNQELAFFCKEMELMLRTGISTTSCLELLAEQEAKPQWKLVLTQILEQMEEGVSFSEALETTETFPVYMTGLLKMGEQAGRQEEALSALSDYYEEQQRIQNRIKDVLLYPSILLLLMSVVIVVLFTQVMPIFQSVYASLGAQMTGLAGLLLQIGLGMQQILPLLGIIFAGIVLGVLSFVLSSALRQKVMGYWNTHAGEHGMMRSIHDAWIASAISMGMRSGLPTEEAIELAAGVVRDVPLAHARLEECKRAVEEGENLGDALQQAGVFSLTTCRLIRLGVQSGNGDEIMQEIARRLSEEADRTVSARIAMIEPILVLLAAVLIGAILLSVMLPLINIMEMIG